jgi:electron transfer flavoprotein alpha subunit
MSTASTTILVWSENHALIRELVTAARSALDGRDGAIAALVVGKGVAPAVAGVDTIYQARVEDLSPEFGIAAITAAAEASGAGLLLVGGTKSGLRTAPRIAERIDAGYAASVNGVVIEADCATVVASAAIYSGVALVETRFKPGRVVLSVTPGAFKASPETTADAAIVALDVSVPVSRLDLLESRPKPATSTTLESARVVIDVGQGFRQRDDLSLAADLAKMLGGQIGCSRPLASDRDWFPEWLGLSGHRVAPELVITLGIAGAVQHMVGIREARVIAAVNSDENAGIFSQADVGVVADLYSFVPALIDELKARNASVVADV